MPYCPELIARLEEADARLGELQRKSAAGPELDGALAEYEEALAAIAGAEARASSFVPGSKARH